MSLSSRTVLVLAVLLLGIALPSTRTARAKSPNVLIILADDCTFRDLSLYGGPNAKTPNIERLASQGRTFNRAYVSSAMCQPCRVELYTGQFPLRNSCAWNHSACRTGTRSLPQHLKPLGYRTGMLEKCMFNRRRAFHSRMCQVLIRVPWKIQRRLITWPVFSKNGFAGVSDGILDWLVLRATKLAKGYNPG